MAAPIVALANAAREVAITGSPTIALQSDGTDEIGQLTHDFNSMLSELALLQEHLQASIATRSARLSTIFELSPDGFIAFDQRGIASFVNPAFTALTGIERNEVLAHDWAHLHHLISMRLANDSVFPKELSEQIMIGLHTPSLKTFLVFKRTSNQGEVILYWRDFTREAEMDAMKTAFLAKAAHELRTPLTSILGFTELLQKDTHANDKQKEIFAIMARQGKNLLNLVRDLLDLARIEAQAQKTHQQSFQSLSALTRLIVEEFRVPGDERKFILALADHLPEVRLDSGQYRQMLSNLLSNALKYSPSGTPVSVTTKLVQRDDKPWLVVSVSDYGMGMQADELARIGERFYRANPRGAVAGTGLGLSVVKELVTAHEGLMEFESQVGQGTRASLWFPAPGQA
jgi:signal transduction histidine kinase